MCHRQCLSQTDDSVARQRSYLVVDGARIHSGRHVLLQAELVLGRFAVHRIVKVHRRQITMDVMAVQTEGDLCDGEKQNGMCSPSTLRSKCYARRDTYEAHNHDDGGGNRNENAGHNARIRFLRMEQRAVRCCAVGGIGRLECCMGNL